MPWRMHAAEDQKHILIVDPDAETAEPLRRQLQQAGFIADATGDRATAMTVLQERAPHLVIVNWNMAGLAPLELFEWVRKTRLEQPLRLIILSDQSGEQEIVSGLNMGADDYIAKPFSVREAVARIHAVLRTRRHHPGHPALRFDSLTLNTATNRVTAQGALLNVRGAEYRLLEFLMSHPGRTFNRSQLLAHVWAGHTHIDERTVDVNVQRLRKILAKPGYNACIQTVRGFGYRFIER
ncbi:MAG TPA: winged helix-turn-helix domain-containing protein [Steroidobacteraceae bacterium]|jgi:two-component system phosphate regulon response regulator PhoB|nr:winged helix-turn-helix domain-containing protein [Steroidobacteraceae bacterium]